MKLQRVLEHLARLSDPRVIPQGIMDEGRIFSLGVFNNADHLHGRVVEVVEGLREHVGQPFELHPWAFVVELSTFEQTGDSRPLTFVEVVLPRQSDAVLVNQYLVMPKRIHFVDRFTFTHTPNGTVVTVSKSERHQESPEDRAGMSLYPLAIAVLNTRGCRIDFKRAPTIANEKRRRRGKYPIPAHYDADAAEYLTALRAPANSVDRGGTHASPIPHLRRAHERVMANGKRIWVSSALVNVRNEGDIAFVERRAGYRGGDGGQ